LYKPYTSSSRDANILKTFFPIWLHHFTWR
jgi:hypothetical protein